MTSLPKANALSDAVMAKLVEAVRESARGELLPRFRRLREGEVGSKSGPYDLVTTADRACEARLSECVGAILPHAAIMGEEAVADDPERYGLIDQREWCVVIDPLDGTWNYANGLPLFGTILAVTHQGETVFGLLYDPLMDDWVFACRGMGTWFGGAGRELQRLRCASGGPSGPASLGGPVLHEQASDNATSGSAGGMGRMGYLPLYLLEEGERRNLAELFLRLGRVGSLRCSMYEYRMVASGAAAWMAGPCYQPWDHAAGVLCVEEAGGTARRLDGSRYTPSCCDGTLVTATDRETLEAVTQAVREALGHTQTQQPHHPTAARDWDDAPTPPAPWARRG